MGHKAKPKANTKKTGQEKNEKHQPRWTEAKQPYPRFDLDLEPEKLVGSHSALLNTIEALLADKVDDEMKPLKKKDRKQKKVKGRQYTATGGAFLVRLLPPDGDASKVVTLLIGLKDLYVQGFHVGDVWFLLSDCALPIPPASQVNYGRTKVTDDAGEEYTFKDGIFLLSWGGSYLKLAAGRLQPFKYGAFQAVHKNLCGARKTVASKDEETLQGDVAFYAIGISECMRFWDVDWWVMAHSTDPLICDDVYLPEELDDMIGDWGTHSKACYGPNPPACVRIVKRDLAEHEKLKEEIIYAKKAKPAKEVAAQGYVIDKCDYGKEDEDDKPKVKDGLAEQTKQVEEDDEEGSEQDIEELPLDEEGNTICTLTFSGDMRLAARGVKNGHLNIHDTATQACLGTLRGLQSEPEWVKWHPGGQFLVTGSQDSRVMLWSIEHFSLVAVFNGDTDVVCGDISPNGRYLCTGEDNGDLAIWDFNILECRHVLSGEKYLTKGIRCLAFTPDSEFVVTASEDSSVHIVDVDAGVVIGSLDGHPDSVVSLSISKRQSNMIATGGRDGTMILWELVRQEARFVCHHSDAVVCLLWLGNSSYVASACSDGSVRIWDGKTGDLDFCSLNKYPGRMRSLLVAPSGDSLLVFTSVSTYEIDISVYSEESGRAEYGGQKTVGVFGDMFD